MYQKSSSKNYVNEKVVRLVAVQVILLAVASLLTGWMWLALFLAIDFAWRAFTQMTSPLAFIGKELAKLIGLTPKAIFAPPKRFAAGLGFAFSLGITLFLFLHFPAGAYVAGAILIVCAVLESALGICLGCYVYNWFVVPIVNRSVERRKEVVK